jgi:hypothetical protein
VTIGAGTMTGPREPTVSQEVVRRPEAVGGLRRVAVGGLPRVAVGGLPQVAVGSSRPGEVKTRGREWVMNPPRAACLRPGSAARRRKARWRWRSASA